MWKDKEIYNLVDIMRLNSTTNNIRIYDNSKINLKYELLVKLSDELDQREYKFNSLYQVLNAAYFVSLLTKKNNNKTIQDFKIFSCITNGKNKIIYEDVTDNIHCWNSIQESKLKQQNKELKEKMQELELYKEFIKKYKAEEQFKKFKKEHIFWYELKFRGISPGCQPKDFIESDNNKGKFGIVGYNRKLTENELETYEMKEYNN
jgi:hypothetical protein